MSIDSNEVWRRSKYYTGSDLKANDVGMNQIQTNVTYHKRDWFPNDEMITIFQMHITEGISLADLPVSMQVEYVKIKQFFLAPEITLSAEVFCSTGTATMDVATEATNINWQLTPSNLFVTASGSGKVATITRASGANGKGKITFTFQMPSGESFSAEKEFLVGTQVPGTITIAMDAPPRRFLATIEDVPTATTYNWYLNGVLNNSYHGTEAIFNRVNPYCGGSYNIDVEAYNPCGWSAKRPMTVIEPSCSYGMTISPNPTTSESNIEIFSLSEVEMDADIEWQLEVYDQMQNTKEKKTKIKGNKSKINTSNWKEGIYIVRVQIGDEIISERLVVKHE